MSKHQTREIFRGRCRVRRLTRCASALAAGVIAILGMTACGSGGTPSGAIVEVAGQTVSKMTLDHWVPIEAVISREPVPQQPVPKGEVPDPPRYTACVAYLQATAPAAANGPAKPTTAELKSQCRQRYEAVRRHMLNILITYAWVNAEATVRGIKVSDSEVEQRFARFKPGQFASEAVFQRFLKYTGESLADELLLERFDLLSSKLQQKIVLEHDAAGVAKFYQEFPRRWASKTDCSPGYIVSNCRQYKGPLPPEAQI